jgi:hypothetical protein
MSQKSSPSAIRSLEVAALQHAAAELNYQRSPQAARDRRADASRRAAADKKAGHLPTCGLMRCAPGCLSSSVSNQE